MLHRYPKNLLISSRSCELIIRNGDKNNPFEPVIRKDQSDTTGLQRQGAVQRTSMSCTQRVAVRILASTNTKLLNQCYIDI